MRSRRILKSRARTCACAGLIAVAASGCSTGGSSLATGSLASYTASNIFATAGYSDKAVSDTQHQVVATGTDTTPPERVEKIAMARAAEVGISKKFAFFKVAGLTRNVRCTKKKPGYKSTDIAADARPVVTLDAIYSATPADADYRGTKETFDRLQGELASDTYTPEALQAASADAYARCPK